MIDTLSPPRATALVVEDEAGISELVSLHLGLEQVKCVQAMDGTEALRFAREQRFDVIILDLMLPGIDGLTLCRTIRREAPNADVPILMVTARSEESDTVLGLESGADDYLAKPFSMRELVARVRALLRRPPLMTLDVQRPIAHGRLEVDPARRRVRVSGREVELTTREFHLLYVLLSSPGIVFSREVLLGRIWKEDNTVTVRTVDTLIKRVRRKIEEDPANPAVVLTVFGAGYKVSDV
ncbi:MAG: response regulator transcription factor [Acidobacteria bacterium]|nr:response regulator transcription factor [Acidobacteriota bacterium]